MTETIREGDRVVVHDGGIEKRGTAKTGIILIGAKQEQSVTVEFDRLGEAAKTVPAKLVKKIAGETTNG